MANHTYPVPADWLVTKTGARTNLVADADLTGGAVRVLLPAVHAARDWVVRNQAGTVVASGTVPQNTGHFDIPDSALVAPSGLGPYGWFRWYLTGADRGDNQWRSSYGVGSFIRYPTDARFPANDAPPAGDYPWDLDAGARSVVGMGPCRISVLGDMEAGWGPWALPVAQQLQTYYRDRAVAGKPRHTLVTFAWGTTNLDPTLVADWVNTLKPYVDCWEPFNEPNLSSPALVQSYIDTHLLPFYNAVTAHDPDALILAPCPVSVNAGGITGFRTFCQLIAGYSLPNLAISIHPYNAWDSITECALMMQSVNQALTDFGLDVPLFQTEQGTQNLGGFGLFTPNGGQFDSEGDHSILAFGCELGGLPVERNVRWYDREHGFWDVPVQWLDLEGPSPTASTMRTLAAQLWDRTLTSVLDFGDHGHVYSGGVWGDLIGVRGLADGLPPVRFRCDTPSTYTDPWGNTATYPAGVVEMPVWKLPAWLHAPGAVLLPEGIDVAPQAVASTTGDPANISRVNDGQVHLTWFYNQGASTATYDPVWRSYFTQPETVTLTWPNPVELTRLVVTHTGVRNESSAWLAYTCELFDGQTWTQVADVDHRDPSLVFDFTSREAHAVKESYWQARAAHAVEFPRQPVKAARFTVTAVSCGGFYDQETSKVIFGAAGLDAPWNQVQTIRAYNIDPKPRVLLVR